MAIITVDSIGNNLGVVLNCNNGVQSALGFDRNGLIGKNVTKIMPKIYSELHNNFMLRFILGCLLLGADHVYELGSELSQFAKRGCLGLYD